MDKQDIIRKMLEAGLKAPARGEFIFIHWDQIAMLLEYERAAAVREALADQPAQPCKYGNEPVSCTSSPMDCQCALDAVFEQPVQPEIEYCTNYHCAGDCGQPHNQKEMREFFAWQPAQHQDIDWKDQYEKQKRRAEMWVAKYEADIKPLEKAGPVTAQQLVAIEYWLQDTMESGRWVTTDSMSKATAEKMLSGEYGDVYPQGRIVEQSQPVSKPLTDEQAKELWDQSRCAMPRYLTFKALVEAAHGIKE